MHVAQGIPYPLFSSTPHDLAITSRILELHSTEGLDILHAHYALPHAVSALLARAASERSGQTPPKVVTNVPTSFHPPEGGDRFPRPFPPPPESPYQLSASYR